MKNVIAALLVHAFLLFPAFAAEPQSDAAAKAPTAKEAKVRQLLKLLKVSDIAMQAADAMIVAMSGATPNVPAEFWDGFKKEIKAEEFVELLVPIYERNLEEGDIDEMIVFFSSPAGRRYVDKQSVMMQESMAVGEKWGAKLAERAMEKIQAANQ
ncbi:MAG TPA: DUF2059 domain-containing protein [Thermoanaerobaculia bacterium]